MYPLWLRLWVAGKKEDIFSFSRPLGKSLYQGFEWKRINDVLNARRLETGLVLIMFCFILFQSSHRKPIYLLSARSDEAQGPLTTDISDEVAHAPVPG